MASQERFGFEWKKFNKIIPEYEAQFLKWITPLNKRDFIGKRILDCGCGIGRNSYWPLKYGAKEVVAFDYDQRTVSVCKQNLSKFDNAHVCFGSVYNIKSREYFDIVFSIGVIQFLENPHLAIENMVKATKKGGIVLIWVYGYEGNEWVVKYINPIRRVISKFPVSLTYSFSYFFSIPLYLFIKIVPQNHPYLKQLTKFKFWHIHSIVFDQLLPKIANYWRKDEVLILLRNKGLKDMQITRVNENSWTAMGIKE